MFTYHHTVFTCAIIHEISYYACYVTGTVLGTGHIMWNKADKTDAHLTCTGSYQCTHSEEAHRAGVGCPAQKDTEPSPPLPAGLASLPLPLGHGPSLARPEPLLVEVLNSTMTARGWPGVGVGASGAELLEMGL